MDYKHSCVVDAGGYYKDIIKLDLMTVYLPPPLAEDGTPDYAKMETKMVWTPYHYKLAEGDRLIDTRQPTMCPHAGADGFIRPRWDDEVEAWLEAATAEEIAAWEAEHPVPPPGPPSVEERVKLVEAQIGATNDRQDFVEDCIAEMAVQVYDV